MVGVEYFTHYHFTNLPKPLYPVAPCFPSRSALHLGIPSPLLDPRSTKSLTSYASGTWTMSNSQLKPWSDNPNAPKISYDQYFEEKVYFVGVFLGSILYGTHEARFHTRLMADTYFVSPVYSRDRHRVVLPMRLRAT